MPTRISSHRLAPSPPHTHRRGNGPSITAGCVVLRLDRYCGRLRRPPGQRSTSRGHRLSDATRRQQQTRRLPGRGGPPQFPPPPSRGVPRPIRRGVPYGWLPGSSPPPWPSPRFREARPSPVRRNFNFERPDTAELLEHGPICATVRSASCHVCDLGEGPLRRGVRIGRAFCSRHRLRLRRTSLPSDRKGNPCRPVPG